jgi:hypothetical protein
MVMHKKAALPPFLLAARYACAAVLCATAALAVAQPAAPAAADLEATRALVREGARELALTRIEALQPADNAAARWAEWENLRCEVLSALGRHEELLKHAGALPPRTQDRQFRACLAGAARSALATGDPALARAYLARLFWRTEAPAAAADTREARLMVIESYLAEQQPDDAYRLMLRYQQDYAPLGEAAAVRFTDALLAAGREKDAINWFAQLPDDAPARLRMRLRMGLATPEQTIVQARALAAKQPSVEGYWVALGEAAALQKNRMLQVEALERGLDVANAREPAHVARLAEALWKQYADLAMEAANRAGLLKGDDARWSDYAARRFGPEPAVARALFAQLARTSASRETRFTSQLQLVTSLTEQNLGRTALRLFEDPRVFPVTDLDPQVRYQLGRVAAANNRPALAAQLIEALPSPPAVSAEEWQVSLASVHLKAGNAERAAAELQKFAAGRAALPAALVTRAAALASELAEAGQAKAAVEVLRSLAPRAEGAARRDVLIAQARAAEAAADYRNAAGAWLDAAFVAPPANDVAGLRLRAAQALARAGLKEDARAQYDWLLKNTKDAATLDAARRDLQRL